MYHIHKTKNRAALFSLLLVVFVDMIGLGLVVPVLPLIFLGNEVLAPSVSLATRTFLLGLLIAAFPMAQFFGAPILGVLSDRYGRKPILLISILGTSIGYGLFALGIVFANLPLLFISRIIDGLTGGNISVVRSAIADISPSDELKVRNFGLVGMVFGFAFIFGPFIGGELTNTSLVSWFSSATPFWFAAALAVINLALVWIVFKETLKEKMHRTISFLSGLRDIKKAFSMQSLRIIFITLFLIMFGFSFFTQFFQVFLYERFSYTSVQIGWLFGYMGFWIVIAQGLIIRPLSHRFRPRKVLVFSILATAFVLLILLLPAKPVFLYVMIPFYAIAFGFTIPNFSTMISDAVNPTQQGEIMGIQQSVMSAAQAIPPLIAGFSLAFHHSMPIILASGFIFAAWVVFVMFYRETKKTVVGAVTLK